MAASGDILVLQQPGLNFEDEKDTGKKKRFFKLKNFKQLFSRKKRVKSKEDDDELNVKAKSTTNVNMAAGEDELPETSGLSVSTSAALSLSHDSVFTSEKPRDVARLGQLKSNAISMDRLPGGNPFASELSSALKRRRGDPAEDEAPVEGTRSFPHNTQPFIENGLKNNPKKSQSYDSCQLERSLVSMDSSENELEEDFFHEKWTSSTSLSKRTASPDPGSGGSDIDLDVVVASQSSLSTFAAKHKISIKPKSKRPVSYAKQRRRANSPRPVTSNIRVMPEVQEENIAKPKPGSSPPKEETKSLSSSNTGLETLSTSPEVKPKSPRSKVKFQDPAPDYDEDTNKANVDIIVADTCNVSAPKPMKSIISSAKPTPAEKPVLKGESAKPLKPVQSPALENKGKEKPEAPFKNVVLRKTVVQDSAPSPSGSVKEKSNYDNVIPAAEVKKDEKSAVSLSEDAQPDTKAPEVKAPSEKPAEVTTGVVMRQKSTALQDTSKRKTIGSGSGSETEGSKFGELKLKRASLSEPPDWENLDKPKTKVESSSSDTSPDSEFSQLFSKFQRRASQKRDNHPELKTVDIKESSDKITEKGKKSESKSTVVGAGEKSKEESGRTKDSEQASSSVSTKSASGAAKPNSVTSQPSAKPGSNKPQEVPLVSSSKTVSESPSKTVKDEEKPASFVLKSVGGSGVGSARTKSVILSAKSNSLQEITLDRPKSVLIEKSKDNDKTNEADSKTRAPSSGSGQNVEKKQPTAELFPKKSLIIEEKSKAQNNTAKQSETNSERNVTLLLSKPQAPSYVKNSNANKPAKDENTKPSEAPKPMQVSNSYKRASPLPKDRLRSQTLPEQSSSQKEVLQQKTDNKSESKTQSPNMPQRSKSMVKPATRAPPIKKIEITEKSSVDKNTDSKAPTGTQKSGQPTWISLARKKTGTYETPQPETKPKVVEPPPKEESKKDDEEKAPSIQDLMKRFQKT